MAFGSGTRPWKRGPRTAIATSTGVLGQGELMVDDAGRVYGGDGATQLKDLLPLAMARAEVLYVKEYGLKGDWTGGVVGVGTGTNDTAAWNTLLAQAPAGSTIVFERNKTYRLDPASVTGKSLTIDFNGARVVTKLQTAAATAAPLLQFKGSAGTILAIGTAARGDSSVTLSVAAGASEFAIGDVVRLQDSYTHPSWDTATPKGANRAELNIVTATNVATGAVSLAAPLSTDYAVSPTIGKVAPVIAPVVRNARITDTDPGEVYTGDIAAGGPHLVRFEYCTDPLAEDIFSDGWQGHMINFSRCLRPVGRRIEGRLPFRPANGGHGYIARFNQCVDGEFNRLVGERTRHVANYTNSHRCGSRNCKSYYPVVPSYQTHGLASTDIYSVDDTVVGGSAPGWAHGNPEYAADFNFTIVRPNYFGQSTGVIARSRSTGLMVIDPTIRTTSTAVQVCEGAGDVTIDIQNGYIEIMGSGNGGRALLARSRAAGTDADIAKPGNVTFRGRNLRGPDATLLLDIAGDLTVDDVPLPALSITSIGERSRLLQARDASRFGLVTPDTPYSGTPATWSVANDGKYVRVAEGGVIGGIGMSITASSGNISVAVYRGAGNGRSRVPTGAPVATSGAVACPATGYQRVALLSPVAVEPGDFLFLSCDNTTAAFSATAGQTTNLYAGTSFNQGAAHPAAAVGTLAATASRVPLLIGVP